MADRKEIARSRIHLGALQGIFQGTPPISQPIVQCLQVKPIAAASGNPERYRVVLSDIQHYVQAMLTTALNDNVHSGRLKKGVLIKLKTFQANNVNGKNVIICSDIEVLDDLGELEKIGDPTVLLPQEGGAQPTTISGSGFYGNNNNVKAEPQQSRAMPSHTKAPSSSAHANIYPIESLSPYSHRWTIKARCTSKTDIKTWHNRNGEGKLFSVNFLDDSGEIRATGFGDQCDALYDLFQEGSVYFISSPCRVQIAKKQFSNLPNDYEMTFERDTVVEKAEEQDGVPQIRFNFTTISDLQSVEKDTTIDIVGILKEVAETTQITSKTGKPYDKRELTMVDDTGYSVRMTVWGKTAATFEVPPESVVAFKGVKVSDFGGRSLSLLSSGSMTANPDIEEAHKLKGWYDHQGRDESFATHANVTSTVGGATGSGRDPLKTVSQVKEENLGMSETPDWFMIRASIQYIKQDNFCYPACLEEGCNKKVVEVDPGKWRCERHEKEFPRPEYRYIMSVNIMDHTGQLWLSCFDDTGRQIMGMTANELMEIKEVDEKKLSDIFSGANCRVWNWKVKAKMDTFQEQQRVRYQVTSTSAMNYAAESAKLAELIKQYNID